LSPACHAKKESGFDPQQYKEKERERERERERETERERERETERENDYYISTGTR
jgi:hypothetical protein